MAGSQTEPTKRSLFIIAVCGYIRVQTQHAELPKQGCSCQVALWENEGMHSTSECTKLKRNPINLLQSAFYSFPRKQNLQVHNNKGRVCWGFFYRQINIKCSHKSVLPLIYVSLPGFSLSLSLSLWCARSGGCSAANGPSPSPGTSQIVSSSLGNTMHWGLKPQNAAWAHMMQTMLERQG